MIRYYRGRPSKTFLCFTIAVAFASVVFSLSAAQFSEVMNAFGSPQDTTSWGNPIWGDIDNDGDLDVIIPTGDATPLVYRNDGSDTFTAVNSTDSGITAQDAGTDWRGFAFGDYDGDGFLDLYVAVLSDGNPKSNLIFKGKGPPGPGQTYFTYTPYSALESQHQLGQAGFWVDYDNDGILELFVKNYFAPPYTGANLLYRYSGGSQGDFTAIANAAGLDCATYFDGQCGHGDFCSFADFDSDGDMDAAFSDLRNQLWKDNSGTYVLPPYTPYSISGQDGRGIAWGDYDNDGDLDLYIARGSLDASHPLGNTLYRYNQLSQRFENVTDQAGLNSNGRNTWSAVWGDYDNDGFLDLFVTCSGSVSGTSATGNANLLYHNNGDGTFAATDEGVALANDTYLHKTAAWADYNNDGFLDLIVKDGNLNGGQMFTGKPHLFKNAGNSNHYIKVYLKGRQFVPRSNDRGIGARVTVSYGTPTKTAFRNNNGGGGGEYASQSSEPLHFGIGSAASAQVTVKWPSGLQNTVNSVAANATIKICEGQGLCPF